MELSTVRNLFDVTKENFSNEIFERMIENENFVLEKIISEGHSSPRDFWYDQNKNEFVILISGSAKLQYDDGQITNLNPGDYLIIPAHKKHRVEWTDPNQKTFWIALHY